MKYHFKYIQINKVFSAIVTFCALFLIVSSFSTVSAQTAAFRFASWSDGHVDYSNVAKISNMMAPLNPNFTIFNGDLENDGVVQSTLTTFTSAINGNSSNNGIYNKTFFVRGNHDDHLANSASLWQSFFTTANRPLPAGVSNYVGIDSSSTYLTYSFDYGNSRFIGFDVPGDADLITTQQLTFLDTRLTDAENKGLTHAFIYFHGPIYCVESIHCGCTSATDSSCSPSSIITILNKHPIVSATFHGHEHILGWTHISNSRLSQVTHPYEQFLTSPSSCCTYNQYLYSARMDYVNMIDAYGFATVDVNGSSFTVNFYRINSTSPVWTKTFAKSGVPTVTPGSNPTISPVPTTPPVSGTKSIALTLCPHGIGKCGDNVNANSTGTISPKHTLRNITLSILDANSQTVATKLGSIAYNQTTQNYQGTATNMTINPGQYLAKMNMDGCLIKQYPGMVTVGSGTTITLPLLPLTCTDVNNDNKLNILDYNLILNCYGSKQTTSACTNPPTTASVGADVNDDGVVDQFDYNLFMREFSTQIGN
jgi:hypothetical protein